MYYRVFSVLLSFTVCCSLLSFSAFAFRGNDSDSGFEAGEGYEASAEESLSYVQAEPDPASLSPASDGGLVGCYFRADSALGSDAYFYISPDKFDFLRIDSDGYIYNCSDSTIYLALVNDVDAYTISASRFSRFVYRSSSGSYSAIDLQLRANDATDLPSGDTVGPELDTVSIIIVCSAIFLIFSILSRRSFSYG